jgi:serine/threonine-protein kinase
LVPLDQHPEERIGKYRILGILGKGGMGVVYRGLDPDIEREVAIKTIRLDTFPDGPAKEEMLARVGREAKAAGRLSHPNIITIYDVIRESDLTFIVMQLVDGQSLQALIESGRSFSPQETVALLKPVAEALDYAHAAGIVHRDIKPANILLDRSGKPFLADFGVAHMEASTMTGPGTTIGTLSYMSPEQIMGKPADGRADFFALGIILYELLAGRKPFVGDNLSTIVYKIVHEEPPEIREINQTLPPGYEDVIRRALAKAPGERYQTGREMIADLEDPDHLAVATREYESRTGASGTARAGRTRSLLLAGGVLVFTVVAGGIGIVLTRGGGRPPGPPPETGTPARQNADAGSVAASVDPPASLEAAPAAGDMEKLRETFAREDYQAAIRLADQVLSLDPGQAEAREVRIKAKAGLDAEIVSASLKAGISKYDTGDYAGCVRDMEEVLRMDESHAEARKYLSKADTALSRRDIVAMIESRRRAEEAEDINGILRDLDPQLVSREKPNYSMIFLIYDGIKSKIQDNSISVTVIDRARATATFHHAVQGVSRKDGKQKLIDFATKRWTLEKKGKVWKIVRIEKET